MLYLNAFIIILIIILFILLLIAVRFLVPIYVFLVCHVINRSLPI